MCYIIIDQGSSSTKAFLLDNKGQILKSKKIKCVIDRPKLFHVEINPFFILKDIKTLFFEMLSFAGHRQVNNAGMAIQRSTFLFWEKDTCHPVTTALSWQDSRAHKIANTFEKYKKKIWDITGAPLSPHFGGPKFLHMIKNDKELKRRIENNELYFGPLSAFITHVITGNAAIDESIACRTLLFNIKKNNWSMFCLKLFNVKKDCLPPIVPTKHNFGNIYKTKIPLSIVMGDQQASLIGQSGIIPNKIGISLGTSGSVQYSLGTKLMQNSRLISSILFSNKKYQTFMIEGTINACNSLFHHLEKVLNISHDKMNWETRVNKKETDGVFIPGFNGLSSPYWKTGFDDLYVNLDKDPDNIIRAAMESIGYLINDILECLKSTGIQIPKILMASGGISRPVLLQFIADVTNYKIGYLSIKDQTAIGIFRLLKGQVFEEDSKKNIKKVFYSKPSILMKNKKEIWREALVKNNLRDF